MAKKFENIKVGDQLVIPASRYERWNTETRFDSDTKEYVKISDLGSPKKNPDRPMEAGIVVHRWHDPHEGKDFVSIARIMRDGSTGDLKEKRTITGVAQSGWEYSKIDWVAKQKALADGPNVVSIFK